MDRQIRVRAEVLQTLDGLCMGLPRVQIDAADLEQVQEMMDSDSRVYLAIGLPAALNRRGQALWLTIRPATQAVNCIGVFPEPQVVQVTEATMR